jgi:hypothetical protein
MNRTRRMDLSFRQLVALKKAGFTPKENEMHKVKFYHRQKEAVA